MTVAIWLNLSASRSGRWASKSRNTMLIPVRDDQAHRQPVRYAGCGCMTTSPSPHIASHSRADSATTNDGFWLFGPKSTPLEGAVFQLSWKPSSPKCASRALGSSQRLRRRPRRRVDAAHASALPTNSIWMEKIYDFSLWATKCSI